jgi:flagellar basal body-associated protein FliL
MGRSVVVALLALAGLLCAAGMGYAAYVVSRGSVAVPVTRLEPEPRQLTPAGVGAKPRTVTTRRTTTTTAASTRTTTVDDHGGNSGRGGGGDDSGHGDGGHGGDD